MMTVIMLAYNERNTVERAVENFRMFHDVDISLIILDNGSTDGLSEWASEQTDLTYIFMDEGFVNWGKAMNMVRQELKINTDLLIVEAGYRLMPNALLCMRDMLHRKAATGAVGGRYSKKESYEQAVEANQSMQMAEGKRTIGLHHGAILWKKEAMDEVGEFEEAVESWDLAVEDYCFRMVQADRQLIICDNIFFWTEKSFDIASDEKIWEKQFLEDKWGMHYFNTNYNKDIVASIDAGPDDEIAVLEIGCDLGATILEIKNRYPNAKIYGTEINAGAGAIAAHFAEIEINNIEDQNLSFAKKMFDYIIFGDVLEHLHDPMAALAYCKDFLKEEGRIIANIPNVMHISVIEELLKGNFTYEETGLLDKTHIHLFTYNEIVRMFWEAGYDICKIGYGKFHISDTQKKIIDNLLYIENTAERFMYEAFQYVVKAKKGEQND